MFIFDYDAKSYPTSPMIQRAADCFREVAPDHTDDLLAPDAIEAFFRLHYWQQGGDDGRGWDQGAERQSIMACFRPDAKVLLHAQFRTAAAAYRLIDDAQTQVLVPYGKRGKKLIRLLERLPESPAPNLLREFRPRWRNATPSASTSAASRPCSNAGCSGSATSGITSSTATPTTRSSG